MVWYYKHLKQFSIELWTQISESYAYKIDAKAHLPNLAKPKINAATRIFRKKSTVKVGWN